MNALIVVIVVIVGAIWVVSSIKEAGAEAGEKAQFKSKMKKLGLNEGDLQALLSKVPSGYLERSLYWAKRRAEEARDSQSSLLRIKAVVELHEALIRHEREEEHARRMEEEKQRRHAELMSLAVSCGPPERQQLIIGDGDYKRDNEHDRNYRRFFLLRLLALYDNACSICGSQEKGLDLDHFFLPKSQGGNFILNRADGLRINNAVPMCESCNRSKRDKDWRTVAHSNQLEFILKRNAEANKFVNQV